VAPAGSGGALRPVSHDDDPFDDVVASKVWDAGIARRLAALARPHWGLFAASFLVLGGLLALDIVGPWMWKHIIDGPVTAAARLHEKDPSADVSGLVRSFWIWVGAYAG